MLSKSFFFDSSNSVDLQFFITPAMPLKLIRSKFSSLRQKEGQQVCPTQHDWAISQQLVTLTNCAPRSQLHQTVTASTEVLSPNVFPF